VVAPGHSAEVSSPLADYLVCDRGLRVGTDVVEQTRPDGHWDSLDLAEIDQLCGGLAINVVWSILLEAVQDTILGPVDVILGRERLSTALASEEVTDVVAELSVDRLLVLAPVWTSDGVDTELLKVEETISVVVGALVNSNRTRVQSGKRIQVLSEEFFL
jgi:hypothetical protein